MLGRVDGVGKWDGDAQKQVSCDVQRSEKDLASRPLGAILMDVSLSLTYLCREVKSSKLIHSSFLRL